MIEIPRNLERFLYYERFVNDGSPTGLTFRFSSSVPTSPLHCVDSYKLPFVSVSMRQIRTLGNEWQKAFLGPPGQALFPVHPDVVNHLAPDYLRQVVWQVQSFRNAVPTASPRTVFVFDDLQRPCCLKLDYPLILGRFPADLSGEKVWIGPHISAYLTTISSNHEVFFLPEIDAIETTVRKDGKRSGAVLRLLEIWSPGEPVDKDLILIPAFSLFGSDKLEPKNEPLLVLLLQCADNPTEKLLCMFIEPLLESYWYLSLNHGLIPEAHAQNILYAFDSIPSYPLVVWRDFQGFYRDESRIPKMLARTEVGTYHLIPLEDAEYAKQRRSFLYDWILGHYLLDPLISTAQLSCGVNTSGVLAGIREFTRTALAGIEADYFPVNEWYSMSLERPQNGQYLSMIPNKNPKYR